MSDTPTEPNVSELRAAAEEGARAREQLSQTQRELAFVQAGVNTATTFGKLVMQNHEGEITPDSIKATVEALQTDLGIKPEAELQPVEPGQPGTPEAQLAAAAGALHGGGVAGTPPPVVESAWDTAKGIYDKARLEGLNQTEAAEAGIGSIIRSAQQGDSDVVWDASKWAEQQALHGHGAEFSALPDAPRPEHV